MTYQSNITASKWRVQWKNLVEQSAQYICLSYLLDTTSQYWFRARRGSNKACDFPLILEMIPPAPKSDYRRESLAFSIFIDLVIAYKVPQRRADGGQLTSPMY